MDNYLLTPVRSITPVPYNGPVYDIQVEGSHCFEGNGLLLHNTVLEAMACGTVPIVTDYSAMHNLCDATCAYMLPCIRYAPHGTLHICVPDLYDISEALETAYADWKSGLLETKSKVAAERALGYSWDNTAWRLKESLEKFTVIAEKRKNGIIATRIV